eukprot:3918185-Rhodomonas_salina.1
MIASSSTRRQIRPSHGHKHGLIEKPTSNCSLGSLSPSFHSSIAFVASTREDRKSISSARTHVSSESCCDGHRERQLRNRKGHHRQGLKSES